MDKSDSIKELAGALAKAQAEIKAVAKDRTNPHFRNRYATLDAIVDAVRPVLAKQGLSVIQGVVNHADGFAVETTLLHSSGEWMRNSVPMMVGKQDAQGVGSALTYGRRYGISALLSLSTDEDDDGEAASKQPTKKPEQKPASKSEPKPAHDREWDGTDHDAMSYPFPVPNHPQHGTPMGEMQTAVLQKFIEWAGVKPEYLNARIRAEAIIGGRTNA